MMSDRTLRISRRKLLQMGSFGPVAALMAAGASPAEVAAAVDRVPDEVATDLLGKANENGHDPDADFFKAIAKILWQFVEAGAEMGGKAVPTVLSRRRVLAKYAYDQTADNGEKSGNLITKSLVDWRPGNVTTWDTIQSATLGCAYLCGFYAAKAAGNGPFNETAYTEGFKQTQAQMKATLLKLRAMSPGAGARATETVLAAGCG
jgi:hypothetical protein